MGNALTSLEFAPRKVGNIFNCNSNQLTSLLHSPISVGSNFFSKNNQIISLEGVPRKINGHLDCSYNQLKNLDKGPLLIDGSLWCEHNPLSYWDIQSFPQVKEVMIMSSCGLDYLDSYIKQEHGYVELPGSEIKELLRNAFLKQQLEEELKNNENSRSTHKI